MAYKVRFATGVSPSITDVARKIQMLGALLNGPFKHPKFVIGEELAVRKRFIDEKKLLNRSVDVSWVDMAIYSYYTFADKDAFDAYMADPVIANKIVYMGESNYTVNVAEVP